MSHGTLCVVVMTVFLSFFQHPGMLMLLKEQVLEIVSSATLVKELQAREMHMPP